MAFAQDNSQFEYGQQFASAEELVAQVQKNLKELKMRRAMQVYPYAIMDEENQCLSNSLSLDGKPLDYSEFSLRSKGELTVVKELDSYRTRVFFYVYLTRNGNRVLNSGNDRFNISETKIEISVILKHAAPGDQLVIEPVRKEDYAAKKILNLLEGGC
jgi:hypothetical protein